MAIENRRRKDSYAVAFGAGVLGAIIITVILAFARSVGLTPMNMSMTLGTLFNLEPAASTWLVGFIVHMILGGIFGTIYAFFFDKMNKSGTGLGALFGVVHWVAAGIFLGVLPFIHPMVGEVTPEPGFFALNVNAFTVFALLILHLIYGAIIGGIYQPVYFKKGTPSGATPSQV